MTRVKVDGEKRDHKVFIYTLSTCAWCKRTKHYLKERKVEYEYLDYDTATNEERQEAEKDIRSRGVRMALPFIIIDDERVIVGFKEEELREALSL